MNPHAVRGGVPAGPVWTPGEMHKLDRLLARGLTPPEIAEQLPGRSVHSVRAKITALRIDAMKKGNFEFLDKKNRWTPEKIERLHVLLGEGRHLGEVALILGQSKKSCSRKASQLGIRVPRGRPPVQNCIPAVQKPEGPRHHQPWTKEEEQRLLVLATHRLSHAEIAAKLNRTTDAVTLRLSLLRRGGVDTKKSENEGRRRPCLCCKQPFNSRGPHNRLCKECRHLDPGIEPVRIVLR